MGTRVPRWFLRRRKRDHTMQSWPNPSQAAKERSSERTAELRSRLKLKSVGSGVKGRDERHRTAPLTPLPTPTPHFALDNANVVRDVKTRPSAAVNQHYCRTKRIIAIRGLVYV